VGQVGSTHLTCPTHQTCPTHLTCTVLPFLPLQSNSLFHQAARAF